MPPCIVTLRGDLIILGIALLIQASYSACLQADVNQSADELEEMLRQSRAKMEAHARDLADWEVQTARARNEGTFFKGLFKADVLQQAPMGGQQEHAQGAAPSPSSQIEVCQRKSRSCSHLAVLPWNCVGPNCWSICRGGCSVFRGRWRILQFTVALIMLQVRRAEGCSVYLQSVSNIQVFLRHFCGVLDCRTTEKWSHTQIRMLLCEPAATY